MVYVVRLCIHWPSTFHGFSTVFFRLRQDAEFSCLCWEFDKLLPFGDSLLGEGLVSWAAIVKLVSGKRQ